jgi:hypothetical protein
LSNPVCAWIKNVEEDKSLFVIGEKVENQNEIMRLFVNGEKKKQKLHFAA